MCERGDALCCRFTFNSTNGLSVWRPPGVVEHCALPSGWAGRCWSRLLTTPRATRGQARPRSDRSFQSFAK